MEDQEAKKLRGEALLKRRAAARGWLTRARKALDNIIAQAADGKTPDRVEIIDSLEEFDRRLCSVDDIQTELELESEDVEELVEEAADYREAVRRVRVRATSILIKLDKVEEVEQAESTAQSLNSRPNVKLPRIELPKFSGNVLEWPSFWEQFVALVHETDLPEISKFSYLKTLLEGEAREAVEGLALSSAHYPTAVEILKGRYGRRDRLIFRHVQELLSMASKSVGGGLQGLRKLQDMVLTHVRSLEALDVAGDQYGVLLTPIVLSCLPTDIRVEWARGSEGKESDLEFLLTFLDRELKLRETSQVFRKPEPKTQRVKEAKPIQASATSLTAATGSPKKEWVKRREEKQKRSSRDRRDLGCAICGKHTYTRGCYQLKDITLDERWKIINKNELCRKCLEKHPHSTCSKTCSTCSGDHHEILCKPVKSHTGVTSSSLVANMDSTDVVMQVLKLQVQGRCGVVEVNVLFDAGSDRSYVTSDVIKKIDAEFCRTENVAYCAFGSSKASREQLRNLYGLTLKGRSSGCEYVTATEVPVVCAPLHQKRVPSQVLQQFGAVDFTEDYTKNRRVKVDILIGLDFYWRLVTPEMVVPQSGPTSLVALKTIFGWMLSGSYGTDHGNSPSRVSHQLFCIRDATDEDVRQLWDIELDAPRELESVILKKFEDSIEFVNGRYAVSLPWRNDRDRDNLRGDCHIAQRRLNSLMSKLNREPALKERYDAVFVEMEANDVIEEVPPEELEIGDQRPVFYLPHRPVVKESSASTKVRPVFDASAKDKHGLSLNDYLETGPNLLPSLIDILLRFRRWPVALVADIQKAFLQIIVKQEDRDVHRFLWKSRVMRLTRVPFGNKCSPFLLNAVIKYHLKQYESEDVVSELEENLYVDDWLSGANSEEEAAVMAVKAKEIMADGSMNLTKWGSNHGQVVPGNEDHSSCTKVLGLGWNAEGDHFAFEGTDVPKDLVITKRIVLSLSARLFDPLGFLSPFLISLRIVFQDLWKAGLAWDQEVPEDIQKKVTRWILDLSMLKAWKVPRVYSPTKWGAHDTIELHAFGDASERGYGACVYLVIDGVSSLVMSKAKVAPIKTVTLPRLELLGAVLAAQLVVHVQKALKLEDVMKFCWTDSTVTLSWIQSDVTRWKPFVANRVATIQSLTNPEQWSHCPGVQNPADLLTRGVTADELIESEHVWLKGPEFLVTGKPLLPTTEAREEFDTGEEVVPVLISTSDHVESRLFEVHRWGSLTKAIRVVARVMRFINGLRGEKRSGDLEFSELQKAKRLLIQDDQQAAYPQEFKDLRKEGKVSKKSSLCKLSPYLEDGILRVGGRLERSTLSYDEKHPTILPKGHLALLVCRFQHILLKHAGVSTMLATLRSQYWIIGARRLAKMVKRFCVPCQRVDARPVEQPMAPLHSNRVIPARPFSSIGIDHGGPLFCADHPGKKFYILLITCSVTRAIHLELVNSLTVEDTVLAIRRFAARRGMPSTIWSDNAKTFVAAKQKLLLLVGDQGPEWNFIVPRSPWWGGWWERLVRSVKSALKKSVGKRCLTRAELDTCLVEVEACVNSRPLTFVGDGAEDTAPLTPSHFLLGTESPYVVQREVTGSLVGQQDLLERLEVRDTLLDEFWKLWSNDYLRGLPTGRGVTGESSLAVGDLVLVREDNTPRMSWPQGVIVAVYPGLDGVVRACDVKTAKGVYSRSIQRFHHLELNADSAVSPSAEPLPDVDDLQPDPVETDAAEDTSALPVAAEDTSALPVDSLSEESQDLEPTHARSRFGRKLKPTKKLDL